MHYKICSNTESLHYFETIFYSIKSKYMIRDTPLNRILNNKNQNRIEKLTRSCFIKGHKHDTYSYQCKYLKIQFFVIKSKASGDEL